MRSFRDQSIRGQREIPVGIYWESSSNMASIVRSLNFTNVMMKNPNLVDASAHRGISSLLDTGTQLGIGLHLATEAQLYNAVM